MLLFLVVTLNLYVMFIIPYCENNNIPKDSWAFLIYCFEAKNLSQMKPK